VQTVLTVPDGAVVTSDDNQKCIGNMMGGSSSTVTWNVMFERNGTFTLRVRASGYDSSGNPCSASRSTTVLVGEFSPPSVLFEVLVTVGILLVGILAGAFLLWRRRRVQSTSELRHS